MNPADVECKISSTSGLAGFYSHLGGSIKLLSELIGITGAAAFYSSDFKDSRWPFCGLVFLASACLASSFCIGVLDKCHDGW